MVIYLLHYFFLYDSRKTSQLLIASEFCQINLVLDYFLSHEVTTIYMVIALNVSCWRGPLDSVFTWIVLFMVCDIYLVRIEYLAIYTVVTDIWHRWNPSLGMMILTIT